MTTTITVLMVVLILINLVLLYLLKKKKKVETLQVVGDFIVFNPKGVKPDIISKGDVILGVMDERFVIAEVALKSSNFNESLAFYLQNGKK
jgi:hypothetical protein